MSSAVRENFRKSSPKGPGGIHLIPGMNELKELCTYSEKLRDEIYWQLEPIEQSYDYLVIDTGTGLDSNIRKLITASDISLIVATPEPTSIADAYAALKSLISDKKHVHLLVNQAESSQQAVFHHRKTPTHNQNFRARGCSIGRLHSFRHACKTSGAATKTRFLELYPDCPASGSIQQLSRRLKSLLAQMAPHQSFFPRFSRTTISESRLSNSKHGLSNFGDKKESRTIGKIENV